jgi:hypothetical protein
VLLASEAARAEPLASYVRAAVAGLDAIDEQSFLSGTWRFVEPQTREETVS